MLRLYWLTSLVVVVAATTLRADGPPDNNPDTVRRVPAVGIDVSGADRAELEKGLTELGQAIDELAKSTDPQVLELLPDIQIFHRAVHQNLTHREFFSDKEIPIAKKLLEVGLSRATWLRRGQPGWMNGTGLVRRGYVSKIDGTVQPYGLIVPESYTPQSAHKYRLDIWFHGRGETLSEVNFLEQRARDKGVFAPADTFVLHPYGRYCNAFKFAGEVDVLEALESVTKRYRIDEDRIAVRGFSMGGAACWQFAVNYTDRWVAATPGAGFSETPKFLEFFQKETLNPTPWEKTLWHWYDCPDSALNLSQLPTVAYSGENDIQKQAADVMAEALQKHGIDLVHLIGPKTGHSYHPAVRDEIERRTTSIVAKGRERVPREIHFTTYTLKYNRMHWVTIDALGEHWQPARVDALLSQNGIALTTQNVTALSLEFPAGWAPFDVDEAVALFVDNQELIAARPGSDRSWECHLVRTDGQWQIAKMPDGPLRKRHHLQGPIDDAFMDAFLFVRPTGRFTHPGVEKWVRSELDHSIAQWRQQFRGDARVKGDTEITDADIASANLILWGDPSSNQLLQKIADKLPIQWSDKGLATGSQQYSAEHHVPILIYPNPLNSKRYVVLNSGFTYREYDYLNNARQVAKLPDWAIVDIRTPPNSRWPGKVVAADFFDESWQLKTTAGQK